jgi:hypothetical protein
MPVSETPRTALSYRDAEVRIVVRALRSYGVLHRDALGRLVHAERWREGTLGLALVAAEHRELVRRLGAGFYAPVKPGERRGPRPSRDSGERPGQVAHHTSNAA